MRALACGCYEGQECDECAAMVMADDRFAWEFDRFMETPSAVEVESWTS